MSGQALGKVGVEMYADTAQFQQDMGKAAALAEREARRIERETKHAATVANEVFRRLTGTVNGTEQAFNKQEGASRRAAAEVLNMGRASARAANDARMLNYQITDIATGLATGQSPFFVLMQQGGQLRDQFGSVSGAAVGLARGVWGMVSPLGLAAVAAGTVGYAMFKGAQETADFERKLALTGNTAALTESKLIALAASAAKRTGRTFNDSRETATALVGTGSFGAESIEAATMAMSRYQKITGETAEDAVKRFAGIADGAAKWAADQNRSMHFLTVEQYKQIKALEDVGKTQDAMRLALQTFDKEMASRHLPQVGYLETAWKGWGAAIDWAKRKLMDWGKPDDIDAQVVAARKRLATLEDNRDKLLRDSSGNQPAEVRNYVAAQAAKAELAVKAAQADLANLEARASLQSAGDAARARIAEVEEAKIRKLTNPPKAPKSDRDYLGEMDRGFERRVQDWAERNQEALDKVEAQDRETEARFQDLIAAANQRQNLRDQERTDRSSFSFGVQDAAKTWWDGFTNEAQRGADAFNNTMKGMENAVVSWARTGKLSASDFFGSMAEEFLRRMVQMAQAKAFFGASGDFMGPGSWLGDAMTVASTMMGFANGNPNVSRDGPAYLHEGERVLTRQQNLAYTMGGASGGAAGRTVINDYRTIQVGQGVSMAQVAAAVQVGNDQLEARWMRRQREGG